MEANRSHNNREICKISGKFCKKSEEDERERKEKNKERGRKPLPKIERNYDYIKGYPYTYVTLCLLYSFGAFIIYGLYLQVDCLHSIITLNFYSSSTYSMTLCEPHCGVSLPLFLHGSLCCQGIPKTCHKCYLLVLNYIHTLSHAPAPPLLYGSFSLSTPSSQFLSSQHKHKSIEEGVKSICSTDNPNRLTVHHPQLLLPQS